MFKSLLDGTVSELSVTSVAVCMGAALGLGLVIALVYMFSTKKYTKNFIITLTLLPVLVQIVILMTSGSFGTAVAILGAFSLIRFRSVPATSLEITGIFFAMAVGLTCGIGQVLLGALITVVISFVFVIFNKTHYGEKRSGDKRLKVTVPEDLDYEDIFSDVFEKYADSVSLDQVKTVNMGSLYQLTYRISLKDDGMAKAMIDEMRTRNGNLSISLGRVEDNSPAEAL